MNEPSQMSIVRQRKATDCGVACVAMLSYKPYDDVFGLFGFSNGKKNFYTTAPELAGVLRDLGISAGVRRFTSWEDIDSPSIVGVRTSKNSGRYFHWVVVLREQDKFLIIDPADAAVYQGHDWLDVEDGFMGRQRSHYVQCSELRVTGIAF